MSLPGTPHTKVYILEKRRAVNFFVPKNSRKKAVSYAIMKTLKFDGGGASLMDLLYYKIHMNSCHLFIDLFVIR